ncbi:protein-L-isoaspartate O-methyltransferase [Pseudomaricurvus alcaniphilus]|uniref:protein-L-isoaspartate O-methyltransferase n=1 Tax=Pseudomaricurvus alcaniphilus TaxID=1166482 RepID=UPI0014086243|nr:protein-L-isoaspartate O-methyltransferase [Pseudomaricurvus alcaniphilus]NHN37132.1 protein-L-isoaspartate O-methyltransferase [Pseudomaricurvus alcaniphilus]
MDYLELVQQLEQRQVLSTPAIIAAFRAMRRDKFLPADVVEFAGEDHPLPIGHGQTNSQPYTVAFMLELLQPRAGQRILDVGCGSGWTTVLLAHIVGATGQVIGTERVAELAGRARQRINAAAIDNACIEHTPEQMGYPQRQPYDCILVSAAATQLPAELVEQLAEGGVMVIPVQHSIYRIEKTATGLASDEYPGFSFVPLLS